MEDISFLKKNLRKEIIARRDGIDPEDRLSAEESFVSSFRELDLYKSSSHILLYASYGSELGTDGLIQDALSMGKNVFLPKVEGKEIRFYSIKLLADLSGNGYKGIREPVGDTERYEYPAAIDETLLIMPGVGFDKAGYRLGYGGGFYDRFLADKPLLLERSIAVGFKLQETEHIPTVEFDLKPGNIMLF